MNRKGSELWLPSVTARISAFLFFFSVLVLSLFLLGNFQNFLDVTQRMLLRIFETTSLLYVVAVVYNLVMRIVLSVRGTFRWRTVPILLSLLGAAFLCSIFLVFGFLFAWLNPLN